MFFLKFFCNFAYKTRSYNALGIKNKPVCFVLLSFFRNFVPIISLSNLKLKTCLD